ncbi:MAG: hypothetical protein KC419_18215 [Anaerolineales bacterium]|nr:hypothetical protein [Anaerolineales bacterium]
MIYFIPTLIVFLIQLYLLLSWLRHRPKTDGKAKKICFWGFLLGQLYLLWEVSLVKQTGKPLPGTMEQKLLMARLLLGGSLGGLFTIVGLFYLSFANFGRHQ